MNNQPTRRDFNKLTAAAFSGVIAGAALTGCDPAKTTDGKPAADGQPKADGKPAGDSKPVVAAAGNKHACRGLNECKGQGGDGKNDCAGKGACHTTAAHECAGQNECKYLGGCGGTPGDNACKGMGSCAVPMTHGNAWDKAREAFEKRMKAAGKAVGAAPAAPEKG